MRSLASGVAALFLWVSAPLYAAQATAELSYYADAYADHYHVPRALVHAIIEQESGWNAAATPSFGKSWRLECSA